MNTHILKAAAIVLAIVAAPVAAHAAEITLLASNALKAVIEEIGPGFEKSSGRTLKVTFGSTGPLQARIDKGEAFDLTILGEGAIDDLIKQGKLVAATRAVVARSSLGVAVRKGAPKPDVSTTEAFKRALLNAKSIAYSEQGLTGIYIKGLFQRMGLTDDLKSKTKFARGGEAVAAGEAELGLTQVSEIVPVPGAELAGPLPAEIQNYTNFSVAGSATAKQPDAAKALIKYLASPDAVRSMKAIGLEPPA